MYISWIWQTTNCVWCTNTTNWEQYKQALNSMVQWTACLLNRQHTVGNRLKEWWFCPLQTVRNKINNTLPSGDCWYKYLPVQPGLLEHDHGAWPTGHDAVKQSLTFGFIMVPVGGRENIKHLIHRVTRDSSVLTYLVEAWLYIQSRAIEMLQFMVVLSGVWPHVNSVWCCTQVFMLYSPLSILCWWWQHRAGYSTNCSAYSTDQWQVCGYLC